LPLKKNLLVRHSPKGDGGKIVPPTLKLRRAGSGAAPRLRRGFGGQAPPFRIFALLRFSASDGQAGGLPRPRQRSGRNALCPVVSFALLLGFVLSLRYNHCLFN